MNPLANSKFYIERNLNLFIPLFVIALCVYLFSCKNESILIESYEGETDAPTTAATSVMIKVAGPSDYISSGTQVYRFNRNEAATKFTNAGNGNLPTVTATGWCANHGGCSCPPPAPPAPPALDSKLQEAVINNKCVFWTGGTLTGITYTQSFTVGVTSGSNCQKGNWVFVYTYNVTPNQIVPDHTAWEITSFSPGAPLPVTIDPTQSYIVSESVIDKAAGNTGWSRKYSFSLTSDRIQNLTITMTNANNIVYPPSSGTAGISAFANGFNDFIYVPNNAGTNCILIKGATPNDIQNGVVGGYLDNGCSTSNTPSGKDNFAGNNNSGATKGFLNQMTWNLLPGTYKLRVTGIVKGVQGASDITFDKCTSFSITSGCQGTGITCP